MRFARVVSAYDCYNPTLDRLAEHAELDVLQLDYRWPAVIAQGDHSRAGYAAGLLKQLQQLRKPLYLDPQLRLVTNAGGGDTTGCVEAVANYLCEHGNAELPITAIRGDNQLDCLEELFAADVPLRDVSSGQRLQELTRPLLSAHVELGGGPIQTALDEGSRFIVTGCYDQAAPLLAAAISATMLEWNDADPLAQLAFASSCAGDVVDFQPDHGVRISPFQREEGRRTSDRTSLEALAERESVVAHADIRYRVSGQHHDATRNGDFDWRQIQGEPASACWLLQVEYLANYVADFCVALEESAGANRATDVVTQLQAEFGTGEGSSLDVEVLKRMPEVESESIGRASMTRHWRVRYRSEDKQRCEQFVAAARNHLAFQQDERTAEIGAWPELQCEIARFTCEVPRDTIAVSVDTRPANEWR